MFWKLTALLIIQTISPGESNCSSNPCMNGGTCQSNGECDCPEGYMGTTCETEAEVCVTCQNPDFTALESSESCPSITCQTEGDVCLLAMPIIQSGNILSLRALCTQPTPSSQCSSRFFSGGTILFQTCCTGKVSCNRVFDLTVFDKFPDFFDAFRDLAVFYRDLHCGTLGTDSSQRLATIKEELSTLTTAIQESTNYDPIAYLGTTKLTGETDNLLTCNTCQDATSESTECTGSEVCKPGYKCGSKVCQTCISGSGSSNVVHLITKGCQAASACVDSEQIQGTPVEEDISFCCDTNNCNSELFPGAGRRKRSNNKRGKKKKARGNRNNRKSSSSSSYDGNNNNEGYKSRSRSGSSDDDNPKCPLATVSEPAEPDLCQFYTNFVNELDGLKEAYSATITSPVAFCNELEGLKTVIDSSGQTDLVWSEIINTWTIFACADP